MTESARRAIAASDCLVGYSTYIKLLGGLTAGKEVIVSGMTKELNRADSAVKKALEGKTVSIISSGDPGIYGMAGVVLEFLQRGTWEKIDIEIVPGIMSANACAALLGAPLMNDFAAISLSDIMTERKTIEKRITAAASADFVIIFYNPKSRTRTRPFARAMDIISRYRLPQTPVGVVRNAYRDGQAVKIVCLKDLAALKDIDMATTIIIGNSTTYVKNGYMVTPRGYKTKKKGVS